MADRVGGPNEEAWQIVKKTAGEARMQKIYDASSQLKKQPKVPDDARFLINAWIEVANIMGERLLRERESTQARSRRQQAEARSRSDSRSTRGFFGFFLGALVTVAIFVVADKLGIVSLVIPPAPR